MKKILIIVTVALLFSCNSTKEGNNQYNEFVLVKGGTFKHPQSEETISVNDFYIAKYEVTEQQWQEVAIDGLAKRIGRENRENVPVCDISWEQAAEFCNALSEREGYDGWYVKKGSGYGRVYLMKENGNGYRLPTTTEWEYAAMGGNQSKGYVYSGSNDLIEVAHFGANQPCVVGIYKPNELGIYDMTGNVGEYTYDVDAVSGREKSPRSMRGGGFNSGLKNGFHIFNDRSWEDKDGGIRLVLEGKKSSSGKKGYLAADWKAFRLRGKVKTCDEHYKLEFDESGKLVARGGSNVEYNDDKGLTGTMYVGDKSMPGRYEVGTFKPGRVGLYVVRDKEGRLREFSSDMDGFTCECNADGFIRWHAMSTGSYSEKTEYKEFDENGNPTMAIFTSSDEIGECIGTIKYTYTQIDKTGNWTERKVEHIGKNIDWDGNKEEYSNTEIEKRVIYYYK